MRRTKSVRNGSPARLITRTDCGIATRFSNSFIADGTVFNRLTLVLLGILARARAFCARMTVPPQVKGAKISKTDRSKQLEVAAKTEDSSSWVKVECTQDKNPTVFRCSRATPLGWPVEPEV